eukprot:TRINITY_DN7032_c0_g1_i2.p1 TRINITY_DN7032_c0_g1~~TRINITY_DN7032_c0_g1_i2.p1  ORF type:complete len:157 (-),score=16.42 TRINITY_DN7032_c0_g1_i2:60-530(-)
MKSLRDKITGNEERSVWDDISGQYCPSLSWKERAIGFVICASLGFGFAFLGGMLILLSLRLFAILYTLGNILALSSTFFLIGPLRQLKSMFKLHRAIAALVFLASMALTLFFALYKKSALLAVIFVIIQFGAFLWYALSYIPFARTLVTNCVKGMV